MNKQEVFINVILAASSVWIIKKYFDNLFSPKYQKKFMKIVFWMILFGFQFLLEKEKSEGSVLIVVINICVISSICIFIYEGRSLNNFIYIFSFYVIWMLIECAVFFMMELIPLITNQRLLLGSFFSKIIMFILLLFIKMRIRNKSQLVKSVKYLSMLLLVPIGSFLISYNLFLLQENSHVKSVLTIISFFLILVINFISFEVYVKSV